ncbi:hypothetical protein RHECNPAF_730090 [Rhizobium etli CNPAF512]|nr:hypothetical protein RHECNPAF_730090 [Rhizobium etli CNPAF512]
MVAPAQEIRLLTPAPHHATARLRAIDHCPQLAVAAPETITIGRTLKKIVNGVEFVPEDD